MNGLMQLMDNVSFGLESKLLNVVLKSDTPRANDGKNKVIPILFWRVVQPIREIQQKSIRKLFN